MQTCGKNLATKSFILEHLDTAVFELSGAKHFKLKNFEDFKDYVLLNKIDLIIVGPEQPLVDGIVDYLEKHKIKVFGPNKIASQLEGSKIFTKKLCEKYNIPTAKFGIFEDPSTAIKFVETSEYSISTTGS